MTVAIFYLFQDSNIFASRIWDLWKELRLLTCLKKVYNPTLRTLPMLSQYSTEVSEKYTELISYSQALKCTIIYPVWACVWLYIMIGIRFVSF